MQQIEVEREARRLLPELLQGWLGQPVDVAPARGSDGHVDLAITTPGEQLLFQVKTSSSPAVVGAVADEWLHRVPGDGVLVLVVPAMTPAGAKACDKHGVNWIDLSGNAHVRTGRLVLHVEGRPNRFGKRGRPASAFAPRSSRIARLLLLDPERWWLQKELSDRAQISPGQVSRVVATLMNANLVERRDRLVRPTNADNLLDAWADDYKFDRHDVVMCHITGGGMQLAREVADRLTTADVAHAFTGLAAAWTTSQFAQFRSVAVYVDCLLYTSPSPRD